MKAQVITIDGTMERDIDSPGVLRRIPPGSDQEGGDCTPEHQKAASRHLPLCRYRVFSSRLGKRPGCIARAPYQNGSRAAKVPQAKGGGKHTLLSCRKSSSKDQ